MISANGQNCTPDTDVNTSIVARILINIYLTYIDDSIRIFNYNIIDENTNIKNK